ncbi:MAG: hypothetical protein GX495_09005 [Chloroflexi bacterium]|jgi:hypothetical protein|nr:hypothetical protein [Chloroflexota bacterium]
MGGEPFRSEPRMLLAVPCLILVLSACLCLALGLGAAETAGEVLSAPLRWLFPAPQNDLYALVWQGGSGSFQAGPPCEVSSPEGTAIASQPGPNGEFAFEIPASEVSAHALEAVQSDVYTLQESRLSLSSGTPAAASLVEEEGVFIAFQEEEVDSRQITRRAVEGTVRDNVFQGRYIFEQSISSVEAGQAVEETISMSAEFSCALNWLP